MKNDKKYIGVLVVISDIVEYDEVVKVIYFDTINKGKRYIKNYVRNYNKDRYFYKMSYDYNYQYSSLFDKIKLIIVNKDGDIIWE